jgi:hypothetical protein
MPSSPSSIVERTSTRAETLEKGDDVNIRTRTAALPYTGQLTMATQPVITLLLDKDADPNIPDKRARTALEKILDCARGGNARLFRS